MATMRELKRRISSVQSSQKITGAMKMISSARLRKAEIALSRAMPYEEQLRSILNHVNERDCDFDSPLRQEREVRQVAIVILGSDEGLCGAFNLNLYKKLVQAVEEYRTQGVEQPEVYPVGKNYRRCPEDAKYRAKRHTGFVCYGPVCRRSESLVG